MVYESKVLCAITLLRPQTLNNSDVNQLSLRGPNVLFLAQYGYGDGSAHVEMERKI
jgi:hypothetical protein